MDGKTTGTDPAPLVTTTTSANHTGITLLADTARSVVTQHGGGAEVAALLVRLLGDDARRRSSIDGDAAALTLTITIDGTEMALQLRDTGEPVGGPPTDVLAMVDLGLASSADGGGDGKGNLVVARVPLPAHGRLLDDTGLEVVSDDAPLIDAPVTIRDLEPDDAAALTRCVYRCYGWTYPYAEMYFPEQLAAAIANGTRAGSVAVDADGEVVCHMGTVALADGVVMAGGGVTDPRYRRRGLLGQLGARFYEWIAASGTRVYLSEPVLTHAITQKMSLAGPSSLAGLYLNVRGPLQQVDITDGMLNRRSSLMVTHCATVPLEPATVWVPALHEPLVRHILDGADWPRDIGVTRGAPHCPDTSTSSSSYDALNQVGTIKVTTVGLDLADVVDDALTQLRAAGAEMVRVWLPANQSAVASLGAGLGSLRLGFAALLPAFGDLGDALVLQWVRNPDIDDSPWVYGDESIETLAHMIMAQARELGDAATAMRRRQARRQQLFAALPTDDSSPG
jgi:hypothetical protein